MLNGFTQSERDDPLRAAKRLVLAAQDMDDAANAASRLRERASRIHETALAVSYARPWTTASIEPLGAHWLPSEGDDQRLHEEIVLLRNKLYAHTDEDLGARGVRDVGHTVGSLTPVLAPEWRPMRSEALPPFEELAKKQRARFHEAASELQSRVRRFVVEVRWSRAVAVEARRLLLDELESEIFALKPTSAIPADPGLVVEVDLLDPAPSDNDFAYGLRRLLRALRQWDRRLVPAVQACISIGSHRYLVPVGGDRRDADPQKLNHQLMLADYTEQCGKPGERRWINGWHPQAS